MPLMPSLEWPSPTNKNLPYKNKTKKKQNKKNMQGKRNPKTKGIQINIL